MAWYFVNPQGASIGPVSVEYLQNNYENGDVNDKTFVWNGAEVIQWTPLNQVATLYAKVIPAAIPKPPPSDPSIRGNSTIRGGVAHMKKASPPEKFPEDNGWDEEEVGNRGSFSSTNISRLPGKMTMQEQITMALKSRGGPKPATDEVSITTTTIDNITSTVKNNNMGVKLQSSTTSTSSLWKQSKVNPPANFNSKIPQLKKSISTPIVPEPFNTTEGSDRLEVIKDQLNDAQEWQLLAIEKILL